MRDFMTTGLLKKCPEGVFNKEISIVTLLLPKISMGIDEPFFFYKDHLQGFIIDKKLRYVLFNPEPFNNLIKMNKKNSQ